MSTTITATTIPAQDDAVAAPPPPPPSTSQPSQTHVVDTTTFPSTSSRKISNEASSSISTTTPGTIKARPSTSTTYPPPTRSMSPTSPSAQPQTLASRFNGGNGYVGKNGSSTIRSGRSSPMNEDDDHGIPRGVVGKTKPSKVVRIERDYSTPGQRCQFWSGWVWELEGRVSPMDFQTTLNELNTVLASAHDPYKSIGDNCCAVLTLYISPRIVRSHYSKEMDKFDRILERANRGIYNPAGLNILSPRKNAFLFMEIEYY